MSNDTTSKEATTPVRRRNPLQFAQEVRREVSKVTWPTWKETWLTTVMVFIMVVLIMIFFFFVDNILSFGVRWLLGI
jgi:preprotein translocase subunit SecE